MMAFSLGSVKCCEAAFVAVEYGQMAGMGNLPKLRRTCNAAVFTPRRMTVTPGTGETRVAYGPDAFTS